MATTQSSDDGPLYGPNDFRRDLLSALCGLERPSGQTLKTTIEGAYGADVNHGRLYPALDDLVETGYVEKGKHDERTNWYALTDTGREAIVADLEWRLANAEDLL